MTKTLFGTKLGMGEAYEAGIRHAATKIRLYPLTVKALKPNQESPTHVQLAFGKKHLREVPYFESATVGQALAPETILTPGTIVAVQGITKGKGFAGVVKRYGFAGGFKTHGQSDRHRAPGSIGQGTTPGRVHKGKKMAGRMGGDTQTVKNLTVLALDGQDIWVSGPVPGHKGALLTLIVRDSQNAPALDYVTGGLPKEEVKE